MTINYKDKFYIYHPDGKFTEEQLKKILDAAYEMGKKEGYNDGYEQGKKNHFTITYPSYPWNTPYYTNPSITCTDPTKIPSSITTATSIIKTNKDYSITTKNDAPFTVTNNICREFKYNGTEE